MLVETKSNLIKLPDEPNEVKLSGAEIKFAPTGLHIPSKSVCILEVVESETDKGSANVAVVAHVEASVRPNDSGVVRA